MDVAQPLHRTAVDQRRFQPVGADEAVDGIAEREQRSLSPTRVALRKVNARSS
jgi:hypothetical protein